MEFADFLVLEDSSILGDEFCHRFGPHFVWRDNRARPIERRLSAARWSQLNMVPRRNPSSSNSLLVVSDMTTSTKDKTLAHFFDTLHRNQQGNRERFPERYGIIQRVDNCFAAAVKHLADAQPTFTGPMFLRSQYAYKAAG
jgi:hypothetical protein